MNDQIIKDKKIYSKYENNYFESYKEEEIQEVKHIPFEWKGGLIPIEVYQEIINFFLWTYDCWKAESQIRLWYNTETEDWKAYPMPQEITPNSMSTTDSYCQEVAAMFPDPWIDLGTGHHHCSSNAFASAQDIKNEQNQDGFHFTIGKLDRNKLDLHARFSWSGQLFSCEISDFVAAPEWLQEAPDNTYYQMLEILLRTPPESRDFPKEWEKQVNEKPKYVKKQYGRNITEDINNKYNNLHFTNAIHFDEFVQDQAKDDELHFVNKNEATSEVSDIAWMVSNQLESNPYDLLKSLKTKKENRDIIAQTYANEAIELITNEIIPSKMNIGIKAVIKELINILTSQISKDENAIRKIKNLKELQDIVKAANSTVESINYEIYENGITIEDLM